MFTNPHMTKAFFEYPPPQKKKGGGRMGNHAFVLHKASPVEVSRTEGHTCFSQ